MKQRIACTGGGAKLSTDLDQFAAHPLEVEEALIDRIDLLPRRVAAGPAIMRAQYTSKFAETAISPAARPRCRTWNHGYAILTPTSFASFERAMQAPSLDDSTSGRCLGAQGWQLRASADHCGSAIDGTDRKSVV